MLCCTELEHKQKTSQGSNILYLCTKEGLFQETLLFNRLQSHCLLAFNSGSSSPAVFNQLLAHFHVQLSFDITPVLYWFT